MSVQPSSGESFTGIITIGGKRYRWTYAHLTSKTQSAHDFQEDLRIAHNIRPLLENVVQESIKSLRPGELLGPIVVDSLEGASQIVKRGGHVWRQELHLPKAKETLQRVSTACRQLLQQVSPATPPTAPQGPQEPWQALVNPHATMAQELLQIVSHTPTFNTKSAIALLNDVAGSRPPPDRDGDYQEEMRQLKRALKKFGPSQTTARFACYAAALLWQKPTLAPLAVAWLRFAHEMQTTMQPFDLKRDEQIWTLLAKTLNDQTLKHNLQEKIKESYSSTIGVETLVLGKPFRGAKRLFELQGNPTEEQSLEQAIQDGPRHLVAFGSGPYYRAHQGFFSIEAEWKRRLQALPIEEQERRIKILRAFFAQTTAAILTAPLEELTEQERSWMLSKPYMEGKITKAPQPCVHFADDLSSVSFHLFYNLQDPGPVLLQTSIHYDFINDTLTCTPIANWLSEHRSPAIASVFPQRWQAGLAKMLE